MGLFSRFFCRQAFFVEKLAALLAAMLIIIDLGAQEPIRLTHACAYDGETADPELYGFESATEADSIVTEILNAVSLEKNFTLLASNCANALATVNGGERYILYSTAFLEQFKSDAHTRWAAYSVLAHEIGHHLNNHNFAEADPGKRKKMELEADKFSGGVLRLLGAKLEDAQAGLENFAVETGSLTHPPKSARREAITVGWKKQNEKLAAAGNHAGESTDDGSRASAEHAVARKKYKFEEDPVTQLVGSWESFFVERDTMRKCKISFYWQGPDKKYAYYFRSFLLGDERFTIEEGDNQWELKNGILTETDNEGHLLTRYKLKWITDERFELTILEQVRPDRTFLEDIWIQWLSEDEYEPFVSDKPDPKRIGRKFVFNAIH